MMEKRMRSEETNDKVDVDNHTIIIMLSWNGKEIKKNAEEETVRR